MSLELDSRSDHRISAFRGIGMRTREKSRMWYRKVGREFRFVSISIT
jgi:hypothetical protein